jgi:hypothetical protein
MYDLYNICNTLRRLSIIDFKVSSMVFDGYLYDPKRLIDIHALAIKAKI